MSADQIDAIALAILKNFDWAIHALAPEQPLSWLQPFLGPHLGIRALINAPGGKLGNERFHNRLRTEGGADGRKLHHHKIAVAIRDHAW